MAGLFVILVVLNFQQALAFEFKQVKGGEFRPLYSKDKPVKVLDFEILETAVTNDDFLQFVRSQSRWQRSKISTLFADAKYLSHWKGNFEFGQDVEPSAPVTFVSWFAAKAFCESHSWRLPTVVEWEYLAQFGPENEKIDVKDIILNWYSKPNPKVLPKVKSTFKNKFGVWDVHGLVWEWNYDFNTAFVTGESRGDSALEKSMFCGSGAVGAADPSDYAAFMRFGFRSSLKGRYTVSNLGFRCVKEHVK